MSNSKSKLFLARRDAAAHPGAPPGLKGGKRSLWSVKMAANWRIIFEFENGAAHILDLGNYH